MAQMTCFRPRKCLLGVRTIEVRTMGDVILGKYSPKRDVNRQIQVIIDLHYNSHTFIMICVNLIYPNME